MSYFQETAEAIDKLIADNARLTRERDALLAACRRALAYAGLNRVTVPLDESSESIQTALYDAIALCEKGVP